MNKYSFPFIAWWTQVCALIVLSFWLYYYNIFTIIYESDITHITQVIVIIFLLGTLRIGWFSWKWFQSEGEWNVKNSIQKNLSQWWFVSEQYMALGLIGTVAGFAYLLWHNFTGTTLGGDASQAIITILPKIISSMGTIYFTTLAGLVASFLTKIQLFFFTIISGIDE